MENGAAERLPPSTWRAAVLVGALSAVLGAIRLGDKSLWFDEAFNGTRIRQSWGNVLHMVGDTEMSQALYMLLLKPWSVAAPYSEVWLRLPSVTAAALAAGLLVPFGARVFDRATGIFAGILLATNAMLVGWSQQARTYALVTLAVVVASLLFVQALDEPRRRNWMLYAVAAGVAVYCHFFAGFVIVAHVASLPFAPRRPPLRRVLEAAVVFVTVISMAVYFTATAGRGQLGWINQPSLEMLRDVAERTSGDNRVLLLAVAAGLVLMTVAARRHRPAASWQLALVGGWIGLPIGLALLVSLVQPILAVRYAIVITPALALAASVLLSALWRKRRAAALVTLAAVLVASAAQIGNWYGRHTEDWRGAVAYVTRERGPADDIKVAPHWALEGVRFYDGSSTISFEPVTRRTFIYIRLGAPGQTADIVRRAVGPVAVRTISERSFGRSVRVRVVEPVPSAADG